MERFRTHMHVDKVEISALSAEYLKTKAPFDGFLHMFDIDVGSQSSIKPYVGSRTVVEIASAGLTKAGQFRFLGNIPIEKGVEVGAYIYCIAAETANAVWYFSTVPTGGGSVNWRGRGYQYANIEGFSVSDTGTGSTIDLDLKPVDQEIYEIQQLLLYQNSGGAKNVSIYIRDDVNSQSVPLADSFSLGTDTWHEVELRYPYRIDNDCYLRYRVPSITGDLEMKGVVRKWYR